MGGESALRLDVPAGRLHAFGASFSIDEAFVVLAAVLFLTALLLLGTLLLGRAWCGWACPQTLLGELTRLAPRIAPRIAPRAAPRIAPRAGGRASARGRALREALRLALAALLSAVVAASLLWYFVSPHAFFHRLAAGTLGPVLAGAWAVLGAIVFADLGFVGATFCATVCPYAKLQGVLFDRRTLVVAYDARRAADCVDCGACVRVCPTGIDIRQGLQMECIACAACVDACAPIMRKLRRPGDLVGWFFGEPGATGRLARPGTLALGAASAATLALLVWVVAARELVALTALGDDAFTPRRAPDGHVLNAYALELANRGREPVSVTLALALGGAETSLRPARVQLAPGERRSVRVVASARGPLAPGRRGAELSAEARAGERRIARAAQAVPFVVPEDR